MAELPAYTASSSSTAPAKAVTGFQSTVSYNSPLGALSLSVLNESSRQLATNAGIEAAERGKIPIFQFTSTDKEYTQAYEGQAYGNAYSAGSDFLAKIAFEVQKNPTPDSLAQYKQAAEEYASSASTGVSDKVGRKLVSDLTSVYQSHYWQLAGAVESKNQQNLREQNALNLSKAADSVQQLNFSGDYSAAKAATETAKAANVLAGHNMHSSPAKIAQDNEALDINLEASRHIGDLLGLERAGDDAEAIRRQAQLADLAPTSFNQSVQSQVNTFMSQYRATKSANESVNMLKANLDLEKGINPDVILNRYPLNAENVQRFRLTVAQQEHAKNNRAQQTRAFFEAVASGDAALIGTMSDTQINNAFEDQQEIIGDNSIRAGALLAGNIPVPVKRFQNQLSSGLRYGSPEQLQQAASAVQSLSNLNPSALQGMSKEDLATAFTYNNLVQDTAKPMDKVAEEARLNASGLTFQQKQQRADAFQAKLKGEKKYTNPIDMKSYLSSELGHHWFKSNTKIVPEALVGAFGALVTTNSQYTDDPDTAAKMAITQLSEVYKESTINGRREIMAYPPEAVLPNVGNFIENSKRASLAGVAARNEEARTKGNITFMDVQYPDAPRFETVNEFIEGSGGKVSYSSGFNIARPNQGVSESKAKVSDTVLINGRKAELIVGSDDKTKGSNGASWPLFYINQEGIQLPILDVDGSQARWYADTKAIETYKQEKVKARNEKLTEFERVKRDYNEAQGVTPLPFGNIQ